MERPTAAQAVPVPTALSESERSSLPAIFIENRESTRSDHRYVGASRAPFHCSHRDIVSPSSGVAGSCGKTRGNGRSSFRRVAPDAAGGGPEPQLAMQAENWGS